MHVRKFYGTTSREALQRVREALGASAMILSNRQTSFGVEMMAVSEEEVAAVTAGAVARNTPPAEARPVRAPASPPPAEHVVRAGAPQPLAEPAFKAAPSSAPNAGMSFVPESDSYSVVQEVRMLRSLLEGQLAAFAWHDLARRDPTKVEVLRRLLAAGFSAVTARHLIDKLAPGLDVPRALRLVKQRLQQQLAVVPSELTPAERGGIYALIGPTGVGKTTTVAKIAAECTLKYGPEHVALVTTDTYRIGAVDQLRIYGRILGAPVFSIRGEADLAQTLYELRARHLVLVDTVGMSQRDRRVVDQVTLLSGAGRRVQRLLLLAAVSQANVLEDVVRSYAKDDVAGCILTKVDETLTLGGALDILLRYKLPLQYVTNGQRVPEDLHRPNTLYLVERAFRAILEQPGTTSPEDFPLVFAAGDAGSPLNTVPVP